MAHHDAVWAEIVQPQAVAILTPWSNGDRFLPHNEDLDRILAVGAELYLAATPSLRRATKDREVARLIGRLHSGELEELTGWGQVRARRTGQESRWRVECAGDARPVQRRD